MTRVEPSARLQPELVLDPSTDKLALIGQLQ
jgi:hypothetical protein